MSLSRAFPFFHLLVFFAGRTPRGARRRRLEMIHLFVEVLDRYFGNVCELDIIFNFHKAYYILDEIFVGGELCESSKKEVLSVCAQMDELMEEREEDKAAGGSSGRVRK